MAKSGGDRGRLRAEDVPPVPGADVLARRDRDAQDVLRRLVESAGGRYGIRGQIPVEVSDMLVDLFDRWARDHAVRRQGRLYFSGQPGQWRALQRLYPLQDPNRWDRLRQALLARLEDQGWTRAAPPRGAGFYLPD